MTTMIILVVLAVVKMVIFGEVLACVLNTINSIAGGNGGWYVAYNSQYYGWFSVIALIAVFMMFIIERRVLTRTPLF